MCKRSKKTEDVCLYVSVTLLLFVNTVMGGGLKISQAYHSSSRLSKNDGSINPSLSMSPVDKTGQNKMFSPCLGRVIICYRPEVTIEDRSSNFIIPYD